MIPSTLSAGFRKCGIYLFNPEAPRLLRKQKETTKTTEEEQQHSLRQLTTTLEPSSTTEKEEQHSQSPSAPLASAIPYPSPTDISELTVNQFTVEEEVRYEERFDLYDPRYILWLECNHPEALPADRYSLVPAPSNSQDGHDTSSLLPHFSSVTPTDPLQFSR